MNALTINNMNSAVDMSAILGGDEVLLRYRGPHILNGTWSYRGTRYRRKGTTFSFRYGWLRVYDKLKVYTRTQVLHQHFDAYWT